MIPSVRILRPAEGVYAFYAGRVEGERFAQERNWVDVGALALGIASYAIVDGGEALVYDTHVTVEHAQMVRRALEQAGVHTFTVVLSHWHVDHVAGTAAFADCEIVAGERTASVLARNRAAIETGTLEGRPAIDPLFLPTRTFSDRLRLAVGSLQRCRDEPQLRTTELRELISEPLAAGWITYFAPYEDVHRENLETVLAFSET